VKRKSFSLALRKSIIFASSDFRFPNVSIVASLGGGKNTGIAVCRIWPLNRGKSSCGGGSGIGSDIIWGGRNNFLNSK